MKLLRAIQVVLLAFFLPWVLMAVKPPSFLDTNPFIPYFIIAVSLVALVIIEIVLHSKRKKTQKYIHSFEFENKDIYECEAEIAQIDQFLLGEKGICIVSGQIGAGKSFIVSSALKKRRYEFGFIVSSSFFDNPSCISVLRGISTQLNTKVSYEINVSSYINFILSEISKLHKKKAVLVFDNIDVMFDQDTPEFISKRKEFAQIISSLIRAESVNIRVILITSQQLGINPFGVPIGRTCSVSVSKLSNESIKKIIFNETGISTVSQNVLRMSDGNPSFAISFAIWEKENNGETTEYNNTPTNQYIRHYIDSLTYCQKALLFLFCSSRSYLTKSEISEMFQKIGYSNLRFLSEDVDESINQLLGKYLIQKVDTEYYKPTPVFIPLVNSIVIDEYISMFSGNRNKSKNFLSATFCDFCYWSMEKRINIHNSIFLPIINRLEFSDICLKNISIEELESVIEENCTVDSFDSVFILSNLFSLLVYANTSLSGLSINNRKIIGIDFSETRLFDVDFSGLELEKCQFADRIGAAYSVKFTNENRILVGLASGGVELRNSENLVRCHRLEAHSEPVRALAFDNNRNLAFSGGEDGKINIYSIRNDELKIEESFYLHSKWIWRLLVYNNKLVSIASDNYLGVIDLDNYMCTKVNIQTDRNWDATIIDGYIYVGSEDGILRRANVDILNGMNYSWEIVAKCDSPIKCVSASNTYLFLGCRNGQINMVSICEPYTKNTISVEDAPIRDLYYDKKTKYLLSVGDNGYIRVYYSESINYKLIHESKIQTSRIWEIDVNDSGMSVICGDDRKITLWNLLTKYPFYTTSGYGQSMRGYDFNGKEILLACNDNILRRIVFDENNEIIISFPYTLDKGERIVGVAFLENHKCVCCLQNGDVVLFSENYQVIKRINAHLASIESVARSNDYKMLATGGEDRRISVFDSQLKVLFSPNEFHTSRIWAVNFTFNGSNLISAGGDFFIVTWDIEKKEPKYIVPNAHNNLILSVTSLKDGRYISAGTDGTLRLWQGISCLKMRVTSCLVYDLLSVDEQYVLAVGRSKDTKQGGWMVIKWYFDSDENNYLETVLNHFSGAARTIIHVYNRFFVGGDMPYLLEINSDTLEVINSTIIPSIYSGLIVDTKRLISTNGENIPLLGGEIV